MAQILVRGLDPAAVARLKAQAKRNGRSLQGEIRAVLEDAAGGSVNEVLDQLARLRKGFGRRFSDSTQLIREDRQR